MLENKLHSLTYWLVPIIWIVAVFLSNNIMDYFIILGAVCVNLICMIKKVNFRALSLFILTLTPALLAIFFSTYLFAKTISPNHNITQAFIMSARLFTLSIVSFSFMLHTKHDKIIMYLMQKKILNIKIGYAMLSIFNTFTYLSNEWKRIQLAYRMRYQCRFISPKIIFPLLVAAARHAHALSLSLYNRGLNNNKSFYARENSFSIYDFIYAIINAIAVVVVFYS